MDYGSKIKDIRKSMNLSQQEFGKKIGIATMVVSRLESNETSIKAPILTKLEQLGFNSAWILTNQGHMLKENDSSTQTCTVPIVDIQAAAGKGHINDSELIIGSAQIGVEFRAHWGKNIVIIKISGDSMEPTIPKNSWILVQQTKQLKSEGVFIFNHDNEIRCKRIQKKGTGDIIVKSDNPLYDIEIYPKGSQQLGELLLIGEVVGIMNQV